jgi:hypothetical protein
MKNAGKREFVIGMGLTRRDWALLLTAAPIATPLLAAQVATPPPIPQPAAAPSSDTTEQRLAKAVSNVRQVSDRLAQTEVPVGVEPAFSFHV